ncbi:MAG: copper homeostasis protein CutC [Cyclobacteriaceae bacterium]
MTIKEACVETLDQCIQAEKVGANRIELCADLASDGLTPGRKLIEEVVKKVSIPVRVMIRPRAGDFDYSDEEIHEMQESVSYCKEIGVEGVVFGVCTKNRQLNIQAIDRLAGLASPLKVTVHKAIDECDDVKIQLKELIKLHNVHSVLTSGQQATAIDGMPLLSELVELAGDKIEVIACGKITNLNFDQIHKTLGAKAYHGKKIVGTLTLPENIEI